MENLDNKKSINEENHIYNELIKMSSSLSSHFTENMQNIVNIIDFFNSISLEFKNFGKGIKFPKNVSKLSFFYESQISFTGKINQISNLIKNGIIDPLTIYKDNYEKDNKEILISLSKIMEELNNHQNILNNIKQNYYNNKIILNNENIISNKEEINNLENNYYTIYFTEYDKINKILVDSEKKYMTIKEKLLKIENENNIIIIDIMNEFLNIINNELELFKSDNNILMIKINKYSNENKIFLFNNSILDKKWEQNIKLDCFNDNNNLQNNNINNSKNDFYFKKVEDYEMIIYNRINDNFLNNNVFNNKNYSSKIELFFSELKSEKSIDNNLLKDINDIIKKNKSNNLFYELFFSLYNESIKKTNLEQKYISSLFIFKSFSNLVCLTNIINYIIEDIKDKLLSKENKGYYFIFDQIISIGENSVFDNTFMCSLLNKNKIFKNIFIWKNSIFHKIIILLNNIVKELLQEEEGNSINIKDLKKNLIKIALKVKSNINLFNNKNNIELAGLNKYIEYYDQLIVEQKEYINEKYSNEILHEVIKSYLKHMGNYNYILEKPSEINDIILNDFNIDNKQLIEFYIKYYRVCTNTNKKERPKNIYSFKNPKIKEKIFLIKNYKYKIINKKYPCNLSLKGSKYIILKNISKYLDSNDNLKLMHLNKGLININKEFYKNLLKDKNISNKKRISVWKSYLKCKTYSSVFNYNELLSQTNQKETINDNKKINEQIIKDLKRTKVRQKETPASLFKILRCFAYSNNNINYYQGMNLISLFLFELTGNDEDTFLILNNLIYFTQFGDIIENNFQKLKLYYYIIERLIYIYLPRIYSHFKDNQVKVIYFINPYFLTLFTNIYSNLPDNELSFLLYVWDHFILNGWISVFEIFLAIFKYIEKKILSLKGDEILTFLANDLSKNELFLNKNFKEFCELKKMFKLSYEIINLIGEEFSIEMNCKSLKSSTKNEYSNPE